MLPGERKYYVQLYSIKMLGYLLDEEEFEVTPAISRAIQFYEITQDLHTAPYQMVKRKEEGEGYQNIICQGHGRNSNEE